jgi:hypothetical protein
MIMLDRSQSWMNLHWRSKFLQLFTLHRAGPDSHSRSK